MDEESADVPETALAPAEGGAEAATSGAVTPTGTATPDAATPEATAPATPGEAAGGATPDAAAGVPDGATASTETAVDPAPDAMTGATGAGSAPADAATAATGAATSPADVAGAMGDGTAAAVNAATAATSGAADAGTAATTHMTAGVTDAAAAVPDPGSFLATAADLIEAGGPIVVVLLVMSVLALAIVLAKLWQFAGSGLTDARPVERALDCWQQGRPEAALDAARAGRGPAARALAAALASGPETDGERAREAAWLAAAQAIESARVWLRPLEVIASLAPLLGLFGTVLGMIRAFAELEAAGSRVDPSILSGGIWEALLTTAVGLAIAIPAVAAFNWFERKVERAEALSEQAVAALFSGPRPATQAPPRAAEPFAGEVRIRAATGS